MTSISNNSNAVIRWVDSTSTTNTNITVGGGSNVGVGCNESSKHTNDEKALFHGLKSAFRMSREYDGSEYGTATPQCEASARIAANAALAYMAAAGVDYDREESFEYLRENVVGDPHTVDRILSVFGLGSTNLDDGLASADDLEDGIERAWTQVEDKGHHDDAARTALAAAEAYLGEELK